ncbi:glycosyltransferase family 4 protein [Methanobacterium paludis]|uniref:Glycosyl transferase group 1 n=1 Tax=Methanobacterium paludis (strain DSM 25820 / JCM 18151 / SWAN1) TaxID=868131 RepID=F6D2M2_METPW|nr:glycosyltransferase family 4 protein [Methanobacterium paludis]AEG17956.1 glycosyl transferase group 1 [Methanobacterium paludis]
MQDHMKIAVFHNLPSGGAKRALYGYINYLTKKGHTVDVFVPSTANEEYLPLKNVASTVTIFPIKKSFFGSKLSNFRYLLSVKSSPNDDEKTQRRIAEHINNQDYDVVFSEQDMYTLSPFFLRYIKKPTVYYCPQPSRYHDAILKVVEDRAETKKKGLKSLVGRLKFKYAVMLETKIDSYNASFSKYIISNSYFSRESLLRNYGLDSFVSYLGVDTELFKPLKTSETKSKENFVMSVGTCKPAKGYDFLINSLALVKPKIRPKLVIVSNSSETKWINYLKDLACKRSVELEIKDMIEDAELVKLYNHAKLVLYAPHLEPFGLVPLESMACGTPVVGIKEGGVRESVIHNKTGLLTERDESTFAQATTELLSNDAKRDEMGDNGIKLVRGFWTLEHAGKRLEKHLENALNRYN